MDTRRNGIKWWKFLASWGTTRGFVWEEVTVVLVSRGIHRLDVDRKFCHGEVFSCLCCRLTKRYLYFVSRGMQGFFSSGAIPAALGILGAAYPPGQRKNRVFATFSAGNPTGWVVGLIIGGLVTSYSSWRWGFRILVILTAFITAGAFVYIPPDPPRDPERRKESVDWLGAIFCVCGMLGICYALKFVVFHVQY